MRVQAGRDAGFTLIELLVSLAILGMMSALLVQGLRTGWRVWDRVEAQARAGDTVLAAQARLAEVIAGAVPQTSFAGSRPFSRFEGVEDHLDLLADAGGGAQAVGISLDAEGRLLLVHQPDIGPIGPIAPPPATAVSLLAGAAALDLAYFGAAPPDNERRWRSRWIDQPTLPELVRIRLALPAGDHRTWPDLVVHPAATVDTACVFMPSTGRCKGRV